MQSWKTLDRRTILEHSEYLTVEEHTIELPDGRIIDNWPWIITPDYVIVAAVTGAGEFICFRQTKYAAEGPTLALVGGYLEPEESALATAKRELREETGYVAPTWRDLGHYPVDGNRGVCTAHLYLAQDAHRPPDLPPVASDDLEEQQLLLLTRAEIETALREGAFQSLAWTAALALALRYI